MYQHLDTMHRKPQCDESQVLQLDAPSDSLDVPVRVTEEKIRNALIAPSLAATGATLKAIQLMRGFAAIAVVALHVDVIMSQDRYGANSSMHNFGEMGWLGVNFFFVLSGFIILNAHCKDIGIPSRVLRYARQRVTRLYPIYWIVLIAFLVAALIFPAEKNWNFDDLLVAFTLLPLSAYPDLPLKVAWTLLFELKFYFLFAMLIISRRLGMVVLVLWSTSLFIINLREPMTEWSAYGLLDIFNIWNINFCVGMSVFWLVKYADSRFGWLFFGLGLGILLGVVDTQKTMAEGLESFGFMIACAASFGLIIAGAILVEKSADEFRAPKFLILLGDASYSIYLVHSAVISFFAIIGNKLQFNHGSIFPVLAFLSSVMAGVMLHRLVEQPVISLFRRHGGVKTHITCEANG